MGADVADGFAFVHYSAFEPRKRRRVTPKNRLLGLRVDGYGRLERHRAPTEWAVMGYGCDKKNLSHPT